MRSSILAVLGLVTTTVLAEHGRYSLVTAAPSLQRRQVLTTCDVAGGTACPDGLGCCPFGAACTYRGKQPVCQTPCGFGDKNCGEFGCCLAGGSCPTAITALCGPATGGGGGFSFTNVPQLTDVTFEPVPTFSGLDNSLPFDSQTFGGFGGGAPSTTTSSRSRSTKTAAAETNTAQSTTYFSNPTETPVSNPVSNTTPTGAARAQRDLMSSGLGAGIVGFMVLLARVFV